MELNPIDLGDVGSVAAVIVALIAIGFTWWNAASASGSRKAADKSARHAKTSAEASTESAQQAKRSADAAEESAEAAQRSAQADETMARLAKEQDDRYDPMWELAKASGGSMSVLARAAINRTGETAYGVTVSGEGIRSSEEPVDVLDGSGLTFDFRPSRDRSTRSEVVVRWRRPAHRGSTEQEWRGDPLLM